MKGQGGLMDDLMGKIVKDSGLIWWVSEGRKIEIQTQGLH
jgi:hypothetical protein